MNIIDIARETIETDWRDIIIDILPQITVDDTMLPKYTLIFEAFNYFNIDKLQVIILGQDPYQNEGYANGLAFSVPNNLKLKNGNKLIPPSLKNIFKELERNYGIRRTDTDLGDWVRQGVLLLNCALTVSKNISGSQMDMWKVFTTKLLERISQRINTKIAIICWGSNALKYSVLFKRDNHKILYHTHPSPLSRNPFIGNNNLIDCNKWIDNPIIWIPKI